ncbi:transporter substrate-binding domain-containing protein [Shewanella sp. SM20]|uniref:substrate-binding periplasmic protein n=1 Tax=Shewanella TaxID=22 RepID=UPI0021D8EB08|nr:transporter substrate-binding domain-containing protein [Shewanella sp. SM20]MCU8093986.1 transporter substrate-binding domain-containing protein [Shewanella sp. SM20]
MPWFKYVPVLFMLFLVLPAVSAPQVNSSLPCKNTIKVGYNDWPPYAWQDPQGEAQGLDVDLMRAFAVYLGCEVHFINVPAKRSHQMLRAGQLDVLMGATMTDERQNYALFSTYYRDEELRLFVLDEQKDQINIDKWEDIFTQKLRLLVPSSGWYGADYQESQYRLEQEHLLVLSPDSNKSVQMLIYGRGDMIVGDTLAMPYIASQHQRIKLVSLKLVLDQNHIHLMFSKASIKTSQLEQFNHAIKALMDNGEIARVINKWQQMTLAKQSNMSRLNSPLKTLYVSP